MGKRWNLDARDESRQVWRREMKETNGCACMTWEDLLKNVRWPDLDRSIERRRFQEALRSVKVVAERAVSSTLSSENGYACHAHDCAGRY